MKAASPNQAVKERRPKGVQKLVLNYAVVLNRVILEWMKNKLDKRL